MKKIGIVTINDYNNYGNRLQCYALQRVLEKCNCIPENLKITKSITAINIIKKYIKIIMNYKNARISVSREKRFTEFNNSINFYKEEVKDGIVTPKLKKQLLDDFDNFIVGSDQVWNPNFKSTKDINFLTFAPSQLKNSYAASFGIQELSEECKQTYIEKLKDFNNISVREDAGRDIIKNLMTREDVEVLLDPTFLLSAGEWDIVSKRPKQLKAERYILNYFLGELAEEWKSEIEKIAIENNCEIINILDKNSSFYATRTK